jgi:hypothetical protein
MAEYLIDDFISPKVKTTLDEIQKSVDNLVVSIEKLNAGKGTKSSNKDLDAANAQVRKLELANKAMESAMEKHRESELSEMSKYYAELEKREKQYYNSSASNKEQAIRNLKAQRAKLKQEADAIEYDMIGQSNNKGRHSIAKDQSETKAYLSMLRQEIKNIETATLALRGVNMTGGNIADVKKHTTALTETNFELLQMREYYKQLEIESNKTASQKKAENKDYNKELAIFEKEIVARKKSEAVAAKGAQSKIGYINQLSAEVKQLTLDYNALSLAELKGASGANLMNNLKTKREELSRLREAYGDATMRVGQYSRANNGLRMSIGMIAGELPNAAISTRVFIMSLSNNMQGLFQSFSAVRAEHKMMMEQFNNGAIATKPVSVFKQILKSVFSLQVGLMVLVTIFVAFGEQMIDFVGKMFKGAEAIDNTSSVIKGLRKVMDDASGESRTLTEKVMKLGLEIKKFGGDAETAKVIVKDFNDIFKTNYKTIDEVTAAYNRMGLAAIDSAMKQQAALAFISKASEEYMKLQKEESVFNSFSKDKQEEATRDFDTYFDSVRVYMERKGHAESEIIKKRNEILSSLVEDGTVDLTKWYIPDLLERENKELARLGWVSNQKLVTMKKYEDGQDKVLMQSIANIRLRNQRIKGMKDDALSLLQKPTPDKKDTGGGDSDKAYRPIFAEADPNNERLLQLLEERKNLELQVAKETSDGLLNDYKIREAKVKELNAVNKDIAEEERRIAIKKAEQEAVKESKRILKEHNKNLENKKNVELSIQEFDKATAVIKENLRLAGVQAEHNYSQALIDIDNQTASERLSIWQDYYDDVALLVEAQAALALNANKKDAESKINAIENSPVGGILSKVGINSTMGNNLKTTKIKGKEKLNEFDVKLAANAALQVTEQQYIDKLEVGSEKYKERTASLKELEQQEKKLNAERIQVAGEVEIANEQAAKSLANDIIVANVASMVDSLKGIWQSYYDFQNDKLDEQLETFTKINKEQLEDVEDKEKAGVLSKEEAANEKLRLDKYLESQEEQIARDKAQLEKEQFLASQAMGLAQVWIQFAIANAAIVASSAQAGPILGIPYLGFMQTLNLITALGATALIAAQTIPQFAEGGTMKKSGKAWLGDGGKQELVVTPDGGLFVTPDVPTMYDLKAGTKIYPDIAGADVSRILNMKLMSAGVNSSNDELIKEMQLTNYLLKKQRPAVFNGMSLIEQIKFGDKISSRKRGLFN